MFAACPAPARSRQPSFSTPMRYEQVGCTGLLIDRRGQRLVACFLCGCEGRILVRLSICAADAWAAAAVVVAIVSGCGGAGTGGTTTGGGGGGGTTPDMGSLATMNDSDEYTLTNQASGLVLGIAGQSQTAGTALAQETSSGSADSLWHVIPMNNGRYNVENMLTHQLMGITNASTAAGAQVLEWADNGTSDHLWEFYLLKDGNYLIQNVNSGLYLEDADSGTTSSAAIDQNARATTGTGCSCQEWTLASTGSSPYPAPAAVSVTYSSSGDSAAIGVHDPSILKAGATYYLFSTHGLIHVHQSTDRINFSDDGYGLPRCPPGRTPTPHQVETCGRRMPPRTTARIGSTTRRRLLAAPTRQSDWRPARAASRARSPIPALRSTLRPIARARMRSIRLRLWMRAEMHGWPSGPTRTESRLYRRTMQLAFLRAQHAHSLRFTRRGRGLKAPTFIRTAATTISSHLWTRAARA